MALGLSVDNHGNRLALPRAVYCDNSGESLVVNASRAGVPNIAVLFLSPVIFNFFFSTWAPHGPEFLHVNPTKSCSVVQDLHGTIGSFPLHVNSPLGQKITNFSHTIPLSTTQTLRSIMDRTVIAPPGSSLILHLIKYSSLNYGEYNWTWMGFSVK